MWNRNTARGGIYKNRTPASIFIDSTATVESSGFLIHFFIFFNWLKFLYDCHKDLTKIKGYSESEYFFDGDGVETQFQLDPIPQDGQTNVWVGAKRDDDDYYGEKGADDILF